MESILDISKVRLKKSFSQMVCLIWVLHLLFSQDLHAQVGGESEAIAEMVKRKTLKKANEILNQYCSRECDLVDVVPQLTESIVETTDLGFEVDDDTSPVTTWSVDGVVVRVQIDQKVSQSDVERLEKILKTHLSKFSPQVDLDWVFVESPRIGQANVGKMAMIEQVRTEARRAVQGTFKNYCPSQCVLENISVDGDMLIEEDVQGLPQSQIIRSPSSSQVLRINDIRISVALDQNFSEESRQQILDLLSSRLAFLSPVAVEPNIKAFPESFSQRQDRLRKLTDDPYGLGKLRETLSIFKELAGTKEILTTVDSKQSEFNKSPLDWWMIVGACFIIVLAGLFVSRLQKAKQEASHMERVAMANTQRGEKVDEVKEDTDLKKGVEKTLLYNSLRDQTLKLIVDSPKVAKETFGRLLREDGVEKTSRYLDILGKVAVFDLLQDPSHRRNLLALSEYYHKSDFILNLDDKIELLQRLKTKFTASEIKVLAKQTSDLFDFLTKLDSTQSFNLIQDESPRIQSIVMAQLESKKRGIVFEMFNGQAKIDLLKELSQSEPIPKDYLANVAKAMQKKIKARPEFDTENLRSNNILLDLIEKADFQAQRELMVNLEDTNPESSRLIKMKLVTIHMLNFFKEGHLLEIFMGMDREDLLIFLGNVDTQLSRMIISKAPEDLAESWREDLQLFSQPDYTKYRVVEMQVLEKIRNLASNGAINLLEINDLLYGTSVDRRANQQEATRSQGGAEIVTPNQVVA